MAAIDAGIAVMGVPIIGIAASTLPPVGHPPD